MRWAVVVFVSAVLVSGCLCCGGKSTGIPGDLQTKLGDIGKSQEDIAQEEADKAANEAIDAVKGKKGYFDLSQTSKYYLLGDAFTVTFMTRDYTGSRDFSHAIVGQGRASYRVEKMESYDKLGSYEPGTGRVFIVYTISLKGDAGNSGHPQSFDQSGSDPSPTFYLVDKDGRMYYCSNYDSLKAVAQKNLEYPTQGPAVGQAERNYNGMSTYKMDLAEWKKTAIAFKADKGIQDPVLVLKTKTGDNQYDYLGIK